MQRLPTGVTGFGPSGGEVPVRQFAAACYAAARMTGDRVRSVRGARQGIPQSYHEAVLLEVDGRVVRVLCNAYHPIVAFAAQRAFEGDALVRFVDCPSLAGVLRAEYVVLSAAEACESLTEEAVAGLSPDELKQLRYWRPGRVGDVIFNVWD